MLCKLRHSKPKRDERRSLPPYDTSSLSSTDMVYSISSNTIPYRERNGLIANGLFHHRHLLPAKRRHGALPLGPPIAFLTPIFSFLAFLLYTPFLERARFVAHRGQQNEEGGHSLHVVSTYICSVHTLRLVSLRHREGYTNWGEESCTNCWKERAVLTAADIILRVLLPGCIQHNQKNKTDLNILLCCPCVSSFLRHSGSLV